MKIRTLIDLQDAIDHEMAWRKKELIAINSNIKESRRFAKDTALRAGVALLYAHWEGAVKNMASYYLEYVAMQKLTYGELKPNFLALKIKRDLVTFEESKKSTLHTHIISSIIDSFQEKSRIPYKDIINTQSNLNSEVFTEIMSTIGLSCKIYEPYYKMIDETLLKNRNSIAHGDRIQDLYIDQDRYDSLQKDILNLLTWLSNQISNAAVGKEYLVASEKDGNSSN